MNSRVYNVHKSCVVPLCKNTSKKHPDKLFIYVPNDKTVRNKWFNLARRDPTGLSVNSSIYFCEDHFDLPNDMENYMQYRVMGSVSQIRMKPGCIPTKFECQPDRRKRTSNSTERPYIIKKQRKALIEESVRDLEERNNSSKHFELGEASTGNSGLLVKIENITEEEQQVHKTANKSIQVYIRHKFRSKATQTGIIKVNQMTSLDVKRNRQFVSTSPFTATRCTTIKPSTSAIQKPSSRLFTIGEQSDHYQTITFTPSQASTELPMTFITVNNISTNENISDCSEVKQIDEKFWNALCKIL